MPHYQGSDRLRFFLENRADRGGSKTSEAKKTPKNGAKWRVLRSVANGYSAGQNGEVFAKPFLPWGVMSGTTIRATNCWICSKEVSLIR